MKPLIANPKRQSEATAFHRRVFKEHGDKCYFCGCKATDAMHIEGRSRLGKHRYACPEENGRPGCRRCHVLQTDNKLQFKSADVRRARVALNQVLKDKLEVE